MTKCVSGIIGKRYRKLKGGMPTMNEDALQAWAQTETAFPETCGACHHYKGNKKVRTIGYCKHYGQYVLPYMQTESCRHIKICSDIN